ncbi:ATP-binding cassette domain-containing protein [Hoeflea prorocentri]|uniref:ATP-binding cassette domain-containing protein n=1 Tax=Hoeflea prorocentri TaxID=1922333 RepID=A0A9X3UID5_9HYPH|nr:ATP-binding cassette domain-containing protein [Hoeflea prorocentri]MCY6381948.1 ATP-binding cassette domain-containing protein [Hoeflea prorocentri]MDA5399748.1 ATP-binding cassette domain-containing protein [Hoeflea prorocentri]
MSDRPSVLSVSGLRLEPDSPPIDVEIEAGRIVGLAGLDGHGQDLFIQALAGLHASPEGSIEAMTEKGGQPVRTYAEAGRAGLAYLPSDRKKNGIFPMLGVADNFLLGSAEEFAPRGWIRSKHVREKLEAFRKELSMSFASYTTPIRNLSGGNQQKVLLARIMAANPRVLLLNDPTRGVDIQTRHALYDYFRRAVNELGMTIVLFSTELDELVELCDEVLVFRDAGIFSTLPRAELSLDGLMQSMFGQGEGATA